MELECKLKLHVLSSQSIFMLYLPQLKNGDITSTFS